MLFRVLVVAAYTLFVLNIGSVLGLSSFNAIEKTLFISAGAAFLVRHQWITSSLIFMLVTVAMVIVLGVLTPYPGFQWSLLISALNQVLVLYLFMSAVPSERDAATMLWLGSSMAILCAVVGILYQVAGIRSAFPLEFATGEARFSGTLNAAFLGGLSISGLFCSMRTIELGKRRGYLLLAANLFILLMTGARVATAVAVFIISSMWIASSVWSLRTKLIGCILALHALVYSLPVLWIAYGDRLSKSGLSGRDIIWPWLWQMSEQYGTYGIGFGHQYWATPREITVMFGSGAAHNDYLRLLVELGWVGAVSFYLLLTIAFVMAWYRVTKLRDPSVGICLAGFLALSVTDNALATPCHFLLPILGLMTSLKRRSFVAAA